MPADWIRPCETAACIEYQIIGESVTIRDSATPEHPGLVFTVAEWEAFVGGLVAPIAAELAEANKIAEQATRLASQRAEDLARAAGNAAAHITEALDQRDAAIAEREVLRYRDRRTQAVVDAAEGWYVAVGSRNLVRNENPLWLAVDAYRKGPETALSSTLPAEQPPVEDTATDGLEAQGGAQQARGWAGEATCAGCGDHWPTCPDCGGRFCADSCLDDHRELGTCPQHADGVLAPRVWNAGDPEPEGVEKVRDADGDEWMHVPDGWCHTPDWVAMPAEWAAVLAWAPLTEVLAEPAAPTAADLQAARDQTRADAKEMLAEADNDQDPGEVEGHYMATAMRRFTAPTAGWYRFTPAGIQLVTEIKPDGDPPPDLPYWENTVRRLIAASSLGVADYTQPLTEFERRAGVVDPNGEVPEAGRADEAQTIRYPKVTLDLIGAGDIQDRTEGLDAAIEAGQRAALQSAAEGWGYSTSDLRIRAAILDTITDLAADFLYYDRKEDEGLPVGAIEQALGLGVITLDEIVNAFRDQIGAGLATQVGGDS